MSVNEFHIKAGELHRMAMEFADLGVIKKFNGNFEAAKQFFKEALYYEKEAAMLAKNTNFGEPSISVLFRSAATLAYDCEELEEAQKLISLGLEGNGPYEIRQELEELREQVLQAESIKKMREESSISIRLKSNINIEDFEVATFEWAKHNIIGREIYCHALNGYVGISKNKFERMIRHKKHHGAYGLIQEVLSVVPALEKLIQIAERKVSLPEHKYNRKYNVVMVHLLKATIQIENTEKIVELLVKETIEGENTKLILYNHNVKG